MGLGEEILNVFFNEMNPQQQDLQEKQPKQDGVKNDSTTKWCSRPTRVKMALPRHFRICHLACSYFSQDQAKKGRLSKPPDPRRTGTSRGTRQVQTEQQFGSCALWSFGELQYPSKCLQGQRCYHNAKTPLLLCTVSPRALLVQEQCRGKTACAFPRIRAAAPTRWKSPYSSPPHTHREKWLTVK